MSQHKIFTAEIVRAAYVAAATLVGRIVEGLLPEGVQVVPLPLLAS